MIERVRVNFNIPKKLYWQIRLMSLQQRITMNEIAIKTLRRYVKANIENVADGLADHECFKDYDNYEGQQPDDIDGDFLDLLAK